MDIALLIYLIVLIVLVVLIFKFIKKIMWAIVTTIVVFLLSLVCVAGLVYLDYSELSQIENATINVAYIKDDSFHTGLSFPVDSEEGVDINELDVLSENQYDYLLDEKTDSEFTISVDSSVFDVLENETISLNELLSDYEVAEFIQEDITLRAKDVKMVLDSPNPSEEFTDLFLRELELGDELTELIRPQVKLAIEELEDQQGIDLHSICFGLLLNELTTKEQYIIDTVVAYQDSQIDVHPNKLSFTLLKYVPVTFVKNQIEGAFASEEETSSN